MYVCGGCGVRSASYYSTAQRALVIPHLHARSPRRAAIETSFGWPRPLKAEREEALDVLSAPFLCPFAVCPFFFRCLLSLFRPHPLFRSLLPLLFVARSFSTFRCVLIRPAPPSLFLCFPFHFDPPRLPSLFLCFSLFSRSAPLRHSALALSLLFVVFSIRPATPAARLLFIRFLADQLYNCNHIAQPPSKASHPSGGVYIGNSLRHTFIPRALQGVLCRLAPRLAR